MPKLHSSLMLAAGLACLLAAGARPAAGDWLVTRQGGRIETHGPWQEKGKLIVFHTADGKLSSLRRAEVDLAASREATAAAARERLAALVAALPAPRKSIVSITDKDVGHVGEAVPEPAASEPVPAGVADATKPKERKSDLSIMDWQRSEAGADGHVLITGTVRNEAGATMTAVQVGVKLFDETGKVLAEVNAVLTATALPPNQQAGFRAEAPNLFSFATVKFDPRGVRLAVRPDGPSEIER